MPGDGVSGNRAHICWVSKLTSRGCDECHCARTHQNKLARYDQRGRDDFPDSWTTVGAALRVSGPVPRNHDGVSDTVDPQPDHRWLKPFAIARDGAIAEWARVAAWVCYYLAMVGLPIGCGLKAVAIGQDVNYDALNYHIYNAWAFLNGRSFTDLFPAGSQSLIDPLIDVPTYLLEAHTSPHTAAFTIGFEQGLGPVLAMVIVCRMMKSPILGVLAGLTAAIAGGFASELGNDMGDALLAPVFALAVLFAFNAIRSRHAATPERGRRREGYAVPFGAA